MIQTFIDEIDAQRAAEDFLFNLVPENRPHELEVVGLVNHAGMRIDGSVSCLWIGGKLIAQAVIVRNDGNYSVLTCSDFAEKPMKAFCAEVGGFATCYVAAQTSSKARYRVVRSMQEAEFRAEFKDIRIARCPRYDAWAQIAKDRCYSQEDMPKIGEINGP